MQELRVCYNLYCQSANNISKLKYGVKSNALDILVKNNNSIVPTIFLSNQTYLNQISIKRASQTLAFVIQIAV